MKRDVVLLSGAPGSGKGTVGKILNTNQEYYHFSIGDAFRDLDPTSPEGKMHDEFVKRGQLLPDDFTFRLLVSSLAKIDKEEMPDYPKKILILDGYPRTQGQLELMQEHFNIKLIIVLQCSRETSISRCTHRSRKGDTGDVIEKRIDTYYQQTSKIFSSFPEGLFLRIDNEKSLASTLKIILSSLKKLFIVDNNRQLVLWPFSKCTITPPHLLIGAAATVISGSTVLLNSKKCLKRDVVLLSGPPGSGKGSIGKILNASQEYYHFSLGDASRNLDPATPEGKIRDEFVRSRQMLPDDFTFKLLKTSLDQIDREEGDDSSKKMLILDGYPRTQGQLELMQECFNIKLIIILECKRETSVSRCILRARKGDMVEGMIEKRIDTYYQQTSKIFNSFPKELFLRVDNEGSLEHSSEVILNSLKKIKLDLISTDNNKLRDFDTILEKADEHQTSSATSPQPLLFFNWLKKPFDKLSEHINGYASATIDKIGVRLEKVLSQSPSYFPNIHLPETNDWQPQPLRLHQYKAGGPNSFQLSATQISNYSSLKFIADRCTLR